MYTQNPALPQRICGTYLGTWLHVPNHPSSIIPAGHGFIIPEKRLLQGWGSDINVYVHMHAHMHVATFRKRETWKKNTKITSESYQSKTGLR